MVARDVTGHVVGAAMTNFEGSLSPRVIEALAFRFALTAALEQNWSRIIVEGDALQVVQSLNQKQTYADIDAIILNCISLASKFSSCKFSHVKRECNRVSPMADLPRL